MTLVLIVLCTIVFVFLQGSDHEREEAAVSRYTHSDLPALELPAYINDLTWRGKPELAKQLTPAIRQTPAIVLAQMEADSDFMERLEGGRIITPDNPVYQRWRDQRDAYEKLRSQIFTLRYSLRPDHPTAMTLFSHMFLHANMTHLVGNMVVLFIVGFTVEAGLGSVGFLLLFLASGLGASAPDIFLPMGHHGYTLGASGAIAGVTAAYVVLFGMRRIRFFYWFLIFFNTVRWPAIVVLPIWLANELMQQFVLDRGGSVAYLAHFGGFVTGAVLVSLYRLLRGGRTTANVERLDTEAQIVELREQAAQHMAVARFDRALPIYRRLVKLAPHDDIALCEFFRVAMLVPNCGLVGQAARRLIRRSGKGDCWIDARLIAIAFKEIKNTDVKTPALSLRGLDRIAWRLIDAGEFETVESLLLRIVARDPEGRVSAPLLKRLARSLRQAGYRERAERAHNVLVKRYPHLVTPNDA